MKNIFLKLYLRYKMRCCIVSEGSWSICTWTYMNMSRRKRSEMKFNLFPFLKKWKSLTIKMLNFFLSCILVVRATWTISCYPRLTSFSQFNCKYIQLEYEYDEDIWFIHSYCSHSWNFYAILLKLFRISDCCSRQWWV